MRRLVILAVILIALSGTVFPQGCSSCLKGSEDVHEAELVGAAEGGVITVEKTAPLKIIKGEDLPVTIYVSNGLDEEITVDLRESFGGVEEVDMGYLKRNTEELIVSAPPYYQVTLKVPAKSRVSIGYTIRPLYHGRLRLPTAKVIYDGKTIKSNKITVEVECDGDGVCELDEEENALTCPADCKADQVDELCHPVFDGTCDPDCVEGEDPDCDTRITTSTRGTTTTMMSILLCGNGKCETAEDYGTCPADCPSGSMDGLCDGVGDDACDPDCEKDQDPDCYEPTSLGLLITVCFLLFLVFIFVAYKKRWFRQEE